MKKLIKLNGNLIKFNGKLVKIKESSIITRQVTSESDAPIYITDSANAPLQGMKLYGWSKQDGTPSMTNPVDIVSAGMVYKEVESRNKFDADKWLSKYKQSDGTYAIDISELPNVKFPIPNELINTVIDFTFYMKLDDDHKEDFLDLSVNLINEKNNYCEAIDAAHTYEEHSGFNNIMLSTKMRDSYLCFQNDSNLEEGSVIIKKIQMAYAGEELSLIYEPYGKVNKLVSDKISVIGRGKNLFHITKESHCNKGFSKDTKRIILPGEYVIGLSSNNYMTSLADSKVDEAGISFTFEKNKSGYGIGFGVACERGKTYKHSRQSNSSNVAISFYDTDGTFITYTYNNPFTVPENAKYTVFVLNNSFTTKVGNTVSACNIQIEEGTDVTAYESYRIPKSTSIAPLDSLAGIPVSVEMGCYDYVDSSGQRWIANEIDLIKKQYILSVIAQDPIYHIDAEIEVDVNNRGFIIKNAIYTNATHAIGICNFGKVYDDQFNLASDEDENVVYIGDEDGNPDICLYNSDFFDDTLDDYGLSRLECALIDHPIQIVYQPDYVDTRDLTDEELAEYTQLYSYKPTTVIENDSGCWMDVTYVVDTET